MHQMMHCRREPLQTPAVMAQGVVRSQCGQPGLLLPTGQQWLQDVAGPHDTALLRQPNPFTPTSHLPAPLTS